jgi:hypothetical protein
LLFLECENRIKRKELLPNETETKMNSYLAKVLESEQITVNKSFAKEFVYSDCYNKRPTTITCTNNDFAFSGGCCKLEA